MINGFKLKEIAALVIPQFITVCGFMIMSPIYGFMIASLGSILFMILGAFIGGMLLKNPFTDMLKGSGLLTIPLDSKGILTPFLCQFRKGNVVGTFEGKKVESPFDRKIVFNMENPGKLEMQRDKDENIWLKVDRQDMSSQRFGLYQYPVLLYNAQIGSFITKDWLSEKETDSFSRHHIIHANKIADELTQQITNFGRYIADKAMNKVSNPLQHPLAKIALWIFLTIGVGFMLVKFGPQLLGSFQGAIQP